MDKKTEQMAHCADVKLVLDFLFSKCNTMKSAIKDSDIITESQKELHLEYSNLMKKDLEQLSSFLE